MPRYRFQWNSPVLISKHDRKTIYYGGNFVFKSTDQGDNWKRVSPDLTSGVDRKTRTIALSIKAKEIHEEQEAVSNYRSEQPSSGTSLGDLLKEQIGGDR